jgi:hypothetical protein
MEKRYRVSVLVDDGTTVEGEDLEELDLPEILEGRAEAYSWTDFDDSALEFHARLINDTFGFEELALTSVILKVYLTPETAVPFETHDLMDSRSTPDWLSAGCEQFSFEESEDQSNDYYYVFVVTDELGMTWEIPAD